LGDIERRYLMATSRRRTKAKTALGDLYLDRLGQSTSTMNVRDQHFSSLVAVALTNWDQLDWPYIQIPFAAMVRKVSMTPRHHVAQGIPHFWRHRSLWESLSDS
jgi:hypothetical protein